MSYETFLRREEVISRVGLSDTTIYNLEISGKFPRRIAITPRCVAWRESEIQAWIQARIDRPVQLAPHPDQSLRQSSLRRNHALKSSKSE
ncbi:MAG: AlpA family phage regulatory protein [Deltaproteobacteria bacterium]|nr:AlpA family phage regulatory protein [Deltaproteobacteria bacterium]